MALLKGDSVESNTRNLHWRNCNQACLFQGQIVKLKFLAGDDGPEGVDDRHVEGSGKLDRFVHSLLQKLAKLGHLKSHKFAWPSEFFFF